VEKVFFKNNFALLTIAVLLVCGFLFTTPVFANTLNSADTTTGDGSYIISNNIDITVAYSGSIIVTDSPQIQASATPTKYAVYDSISGTSNMIFRHTIQSGDSSVDSGASDATLYLNGSTIKNGASAGAPLLSPNNFIA